MFILTRDVSFIHKILAFLNVHFLVIHRRMESPAVCAKFIAKR